jgi:hypothetical protein
MTVSRFAAIFFLLTGLFWTVTVPAGAEQWLLGSLCLTDEADRPTYGESVSVFLTTRQIPVPRCPELDSLERHRRLDRINQMHLDYYKQFAAHRNTPGFLIAHTESSDTGNFAFLDVPPGDYYVVVTFPAMINGYKVAWQQAVTVTAGRLRYIVLSDHNLVLPTDKRE